VGGMSQRRKWIIEGVLVVLSRASQGKAVNDLGKFAYRRLVFSYVCLLSPHSPAQ